MKIIRMYKRLNKDSEEMLKERKIESGNRLRRCRFESGMNQKQFANEVGYSVQQICYIENGKRGMSKEAAQIFGKVLGVRPEYLLAIDDSKTMSDYLDSDFINSIFSLNKEVLKIDVLDKYINYLCDEVLYKFKDEAEGYHLYDKRLAGGMHSPIWVLKEENSKEKLLLLETIHISLDQMGIDVSFKDYYCFLESICDYIAFRLDNLTNEIEKANKCSELLKSIKYEPGQENKNRLIHLWGISSELFEQHAKDFERKRFHGEENTDQE